MSPYLLIFELLVYALFAGCFVSAWRRGRFDALELLWTGLYGFLLEWMVIQLLHAYHYGQFLIMIDGAPLGVALGWAVIIDSSMRFSSRLSLPDAARPLVDLLMALNIDLALDAMAIRLGMWVWTGVALDQQWFGVPWANFWGWGMVVWSYSAFLRALRPWRSDPFRRWLYPPAAMALSLLVLAGGGGLYQFIADKDQQASATLFLLVGCAVTVIALKPRPFTSGSSERMVALVPLVIHGFVLIAGVTTGIFARQPILAVIGLAMLAISVVAHLQARSPRLAAEPSPPAPSRPSATPER